MYVYIYTYIHTYIYRVNPSPFPFFFAERALRLLQDSHVRQRVSAGKALPRDALVAAIRTEGQRMRHL